MSKVRKKRGWIGRDGVVSMRREKGLRAWHWLVWLDNLGYNYATGCLVSFMEKVLFVKCDISFLHWILVLLNILWLF